MINLINKVPVIIESCYVHAVVVSHPGVIQLRQEGVLIIHPDYTETVIHQELPRLGNLS